MSDKLCGRYFEFQYGRHDETLMITILGSKCHMALKFSVLRLFTSSRKCRSLHTEVVWHAELKNCRIQWIGRHLEFQYGRHDETLNITVLGSKWPGALKFAKQRYFDILWAYHEDMVLKLPNRAKDKLCWLVGALYWYLQPMLVATRDTHVERMYQDHHV